MICQLFNILICQSRENSIFSRKWNNHIMIFGGIFVLQSGVAITYFAPFNYLLMSRDNNFVHLGVIASTFGIFIIIIDELKKILIRKCGKDL